LGNPKDGGKVASPQRYPNISVSDRYAFPDNGVSDARRALPGAKTVPVTALSIEFVAKPSEAHRVQTSIPAAIASALKDLNGFAGSLVMTSDHEARLVTVVTLWSGEERAKWCNQNMRWVKALVAPYLDHCLRVQTMATQLPSQSSSRFSDEDSSTRSFASDVETICV
jgi:hypothetical protein